MTPALRGRKARRLSSFSGTSGISDHGANCDPVSKQTKAFPRRLRQGDCLRFKVSLVYLPSPSQPELQSKMLSPTKQNRGTGRMAQQIKVLAANTGDSSSIPRTHMIGETDGESCPIISTCRL